jgi:hypothetical protein
VHHDVDRFGFRMKIARGYIREPLWWQLRYPGNSLNVDVPGRRVAEDSASTLRPNFSAQLCATAERTAKDSVHEMLRT